MLATLNRLTNPPPPSGTGVQAKAEEPTEPTTDKSEEPPPTTAPPHEAPRAQLPPHENPNSGPLIRSANIPPVIVQEQRQRAQDELRNFQNAQRAQELGQGHRWAVGGDYGETQIQKVDQGENVEVQRLGNGKLRFLIRAASYERALEIRDEYQRKIKLQGLKSLDPSIVSNAPSYVANQKASAANNPANATGGNTTNNININVAAPNANSRSDGNTSAAKDEGKANSELDPADRLALAFSDKRAEKPGIENKITNNFDGGPRSVKSGAGSSAYDSDVEPETAKPRRALASVEEPTNAQGATISERIRMQAEKNRPTPRNWFLPLLLFVAAASLVYSTRNKFFLFFFKRKKEEEKTAATATASIPSKKADPKRR